MENKEGLPPLLINIQPISKEDEIELEELARNTEIYTMN